MDECARETPYFAANMNCAQRRASETIVRNLKVMHAINKRESHR